MATWDKHTLHRVTKARRSREIARPISDLVGTFIRREVIPRQKRLARLGRAWRELLPEELLEHTCLENLSCGVLRVLVDNAPSLYELNQIKEELLDQLRQYCPGIAPAEIRFVRGLWYRTNEEGVRMPDYKSVKPKKGKPKING